MRNFENVKKLVVKVGSSSLTYPNTQKLNIDRIDRLAREISDIVNSGVSVVLVTSGAIATGMARLNIQRKPNSLPQKQMLACVGQTALMEIYNKCFSDYGLICGQLLLTKYEIDNNKMKENVLNCLNEMLAQGMVPIINENDSVSVDEIKLGDNDNLSSLIAQLIGADLLVLLSDIDGLYDKDPNTFSDAKKISIVEDVNTLKIDTNASKSGLGTGGIQTKIEACKNACNCGINCVIANASNVFALKQILSNKEVGTLFKGKKDAE